jgi:hypothetical protein
MDLTKWVLAGVMLSSLGGCELMKWNAGREFAATSAGYAGRFRLAYGHWPSMSELEEFMCMRGRADRFGLDLKSCDDFVKPAYRTQLTPLANDLNMKFFDSSQQEMCSLTVLAPPKDETTSLSPTIAIKTTLLSCPGDKTHPCISLLDFTKRTP